MSTSPVNSLRLYTVQEAADTLQLPKSWIYERTRKKAIPFHRLGKYVRFTTDDLAQIIASKSTATAVPQD